MARKVTPAQYKQMIDKYNRDVKKHNDEVKRNINDYNRQVNKYNSELKRNVDNYNREIRRFNSEQERRRQKLNQAIRSFNNSRLTTRTTTTVYYRESVQKLERSYSELDDFNNQNIQNVESNSSIYGDYPTQETNNSVQLYNSLNGVDHGDFIDPSELQKTYIEEKLEKMERCFIFIESFKSRCRETFLYKCS
jgi:predicted RNase H-like nuclease (RuvC/YqgF family)